GERRLDLGAGAGAGQRRLDAVPPVSIGAEADHGGVAVVPDDLAVATDDAARLGAAAVEREDDPARGLRARTGEERERRAAHGDAAALPGGPEPVLRNLDESGGKIGSRRDDAARR